jgi:predicted dinucleotide-utilizing enzyme
VALADSLLTDQLLRKAEASGTRLYVPHGAAVGVDNLLERQGDWIRAEITFRKPPASIDAVDLEAVDEAVLFEGTACEIAHKFPRSVNAMVTCAIATVGVDATVTRFVADRTIGNVLRGEFEFHGKDGSRLVITKEEPAVGVTSTGMVSSIAGSVLRALAVEEPGLHFV